MPPRDFLIIDDHPLFCEALSMTLSSMHRGSVVTSANSLSAGLDKLSDGAKPDAILLDLDLPDVDGIEGVARLRSAHPDTPVIVVSSMNDDRIVASVLGAGAVGFIPKQTGRDEIEAAFKRIWSGDTYTPPGYSQQSTGGGGDPQDDAAERIATLTPQQGRILALLCTGKLNKQIAYDLDIAEATVKAHITAILRKLGVHSRTQAVLIAQKTRFDTILNDGEDAAAG